MNRFEAPTGPGVRLDSGVVAGSVIGGQFDSMLAKLIVSGANRTEALQRARRALDEFHVEGLATVIPFHRAIVADPAFIGDEDGFTVHTRWIETEWDNQVEPFTGGGAVDEEEAQPRQKVIVGGGRPPPGGLPAGRPGPGQRRRRRARRCPQEAQGPQAWREQRRGGLR